MQHIWDATHFSFIVPRFCMNIFLAAGQSSQTLPALLTCPSAVQISPFHTCLWGDWIKELLLYFTAVPVTSVASCGRDLHHHYSTADARQGITGLCTECGDQRIITLMCTKTGWVRNTWWIWNKQTNKKPSTATWKNFIKPVDTFRHHENSC
jgi:hypothetical protein